jgi:DNA polymerase-3 subunit beta
VGRRDLRGHYSAPQSVEREIPWHPLWPKPNTLVIQSHNPEQEEAEEEVEVNYTGEELEIGFNVNYLMDALAAIEGQEVQIGLTDSNSSCLVQAPTDPASRFVVMPMRL